MTYYPNVWLLIDRLDLEGTKVQSGLYGFLFEIGDMYVTGDIQVD